MLKKSRKNENNDSAFQFMVLYCFRVRNMVDLITGSGFDITVESIIT